MTYGLSPHKYERPRRDHERVRIVGNCCSTFEVSKRGKIYMICTGCALLEIYHSSFACIGGRGRSYDQGDKHSRTRMVSPTSDVSGSISCDSAYVSSSPRSSVSPRSDGSHERGYNKRGRSPRHSTNREAASHKMLPTFAEALKHEILDQNLGPLTNPSPGLFTLD